MIWLTIAASVTGAAALWIAKRPVAEIEAGVMGGRVGPGCVVAQAVMLLLFALLLFAFRRALTF